MFREAAHGRGGLLLLDGRHLVEEAVGARLQIRHALVSAASIDQPDMRRLVDRLVTNGAAVAAASATAIDAASPVRSASDIVALADPPASNPARMYTGDALVVIAVDVQDPGNLGAIVRVAEAGGASGVVAAGAGANPFGWKALRGSMASALRLPIVVDRDASHAVAEAVRHGCRIVATVPRGRPGHVDADLRGPVAILIGGEGAGLSEEMISAADTPVTIPMAAPVESLNAAVAAAILVYEARRQRGGTV